MGAGASSYTLLRRALDAGRLEQAELAAREVGRLDLTDALSMLLLMLREGDARYGRAATRWLGRVLSEHPNVGLEVAAELADALAAMDGPSPNVARSRVALLIRQAGLDRAAHAVARTQPGPA